MTSIWHEPIYLNWHKTPWYLFWKPPFRRCVIQYTEVSYEYSYFDGGL